MNGFDVRTRMLGHLWLPLAVFVAVVTLFETTSLDLWIADGLYGWEGDAWSMRRDAVVRDWLHEGGRRAIGVLYGLILLMCVLSFWRAHLKPYRWGMVYLVMTIAISTLAIALLKDTTHVSCPWSIDRYGGEVAYMHTWRAVVTQGTTGRCFPSGHAGSAYALLALYFFCRSYAPTWRWYGFIVAMATGTVFGFAQQLRGAHYLSHDVWALAICWFVALAATPILRRDRVV